MRPVLRTSTALITSLSLFLGHLPIAAMAQSLEVAQCREGESAQSCLARIMDESAAVAEAARLAAEQAAQLTAAAVAAQEAARLAAEAEAGEEATRLAAEAALAVEAARLAEMDAARLLTEAAAVAEASRLIAEIVEAETAASEEAARLAAEAAAAEEAARLAEETAAAEEALAAEEAARLAAEAAAAEEAARVAAEAAAAEENAAATEEAARWAAEAEAAAEAARLAEEAAAEAAATAFTAGIVLEVIDPETLTPEDEAALAEARAAAAAAELAAAAPVDPVVEAETQIAIEALETEQALQSLSLLPEGASDPQVMTEVITEETARSSDEDFGRLLTATTDPAATEAAPSDRLGLSGAQGLLLGAIGGLVVGSIIAGNREVVNRADDRVVVLRPDGDYQVIRDDDVLLRRPGNSVVTETFADGSSRNVITEPDGTQIITVRDRDLRILRRTVVAPDGTRTVLIDDTALLTPMQVSQLPQIRPGRPLISADAATDAEALARALAAQSGVDRSFSLAQIRGVRAVRDLAPAINLDSVTFATGSAAITPDQANRLLALGRVMADAIARNPREVFLVEGHTDAVGSASFNLALSDRRAESVALALTEYFAVPPQNMIIQGYGEEFLLIPTLENERLNRRVAVRRITDLLRVAAAE